MPLKRVLHPPEEPVLSGWAGRVVPLCLVVCVLIGSIAAFLAYRARDFAIEEWKSTAAHMSAILAEQAGQSVRAADLVLKSVLADIEVAAPRDADELRAFATQKHVFETLVERTKSVPQIDVATIIAGGGEVLTFTRSWPPPPINLGDRDYFAAMSGAVNNGLFLSVPVRNRGNGTWVFYLARQIRGRDGTPIGVAIVGLASSFFNQFYEAIGRGEESAISLFRDDGVLLARHPMRGAVIGTSFADQPVFRDALPNLPPGEAMVTHGYRLADPTAAVVRIVAPTRVQGFPLVLNVTVTDKIFLALWRQLVAVITVAGLALMAVAVALTVVATRAIAKSTREAERRQRAQLALSYSEMRMRSLVETVSDGVFLIDASGYFVDLNAPGRALLGVGEDEDLSRREVVSYVAEPYRAVWRSNHMRVLAGETVVWQFDLVARGDETVRVEKTAVQTLLPDGSRGHLAVLRNITARHRATMQLRERQQEAMRAARVTAMGTMASGIAHELNQPLTAAANVASAALMAIPPAATLDSTDTRSRRLRTQLEAIVRHNLRAGEIVRRLRNFIEGADHEVTTVEPADLVAESLRIARSERRGETGTDAEITTFIADDVEPIFADQTQLQQVLTNLIRNAEQAASGAALVRIKVSASRSADGGSIVFAVEDNGKGLDAADLEHVFEPFVSSKAGGMGIGLAISRTIVNAHGGRLWAESRGVGKGATFLFSIPVGELSVALEPPPEARRA